MAAYWIKLYTEMLDDPKVALLPGELYKRMIQLFLLAGKLCDDKSGDLPDTRSLAWLLRMDSDQLQYELEQLAGVGIITEIVGGWNVVNFKKRQAKVDDVERQRQSRKNKAKEIYNDENAPVTTLSRNVTERRRRIEKNRIEKNTEIEVEVEHSNDYADDIQELSDAVVEITKLPVMFGGMQEHTAAVTEMAEAGVLKEDIQAGYDWMRNAGRKVVSARSLVKPSMVAMADRRNGPAIVESTEDRIRRVVTNGY